MHQFAAQRAGIEPARHPVAEADQDALLQRFVRNGSRGLVSEPFAPRDAQELLEQRPDLPRRDGVNAEPAAGLEAEVVLRGVIPRAHQDPEKVRRRLLAQQILRRRAVIACPRCAAAGRVPA